MILTNAPVNEAIVSNVAEIGEFRIRNSAKAFSILSSGLYANKIRAIIRELSCNAVDSHTAAGKADTPFDVHLPSQLEPYFSIRDYGTGLTHDQVTNIYTTYFESTKTNSNAFIGALGLGSKSPFSYTDNFTVTAIRDGIKGIYSAFINEQGVPSIAVMMQEPTDEPAGVEVKFSVNDYYDFHKFHQEAADVYKYFKLQPVVHGVSNFKIQQIEYERKDVIPGVHSRTGGYGSVAVMGNIAYPIDIPQADTSLGSLASLLNCGLEIHFGIGELDFQASREGLSYIPQTVTSIKNKLEALNNALVDVLKVEADAIENLWERALFLYEKRNSRLWGAAAELYATKHPIPTYNSGKNQYNALTEWKLKVTDLADKYNIVIRQFTKKPHTKTISTSSPSLQYSDKKNADGVYDSFQAWEVRVNRNNIFVHNDLKLGGIERSKHYIRTGDNFNNYHQLFIIEAADKTKDIKFAEFYKAISNPPEDQIFAASDLPEKPKAQPSGPRMGKDVSILKLVERGGGGYWNRRNTEEMVWRDAGKLSVFDKKTKFYYVPLSGFKMLSGKGYPDAKEFYEDINTVPNLFQNLTVYGVRKGDIEDVKKMKNWVSLEDHIAANLPVINQKFLMGVVKAQIDIGSYFNYMEKTVKLVDPNSPYAKLFNEFKDVEAFTGNTHRLERLFKRFSASINLTPDTLLKKYKKETKEVQDRYPLLLAINSWRVDEKHMADYINMIDQKLGI